MAALENLDALAEQLYQEGMQKAEKESAELLKKSRSEADKIIATAKKEASQIRQKAEKEAKEQKQLVESELKQKSRQVLEDLKLAITDLITAEMLNKPLKEALEEQEFVKELITTTLHTWEKGADIDLWLPTKFEKLREPIQHRVGKHLPSLTVKSSDKLSSGFEIENKEKGYVLKFSDKDFEALFKPHLSKAVRSILFSQDE